MPTHQTRHLESKRRRLLQTAPYWKTLNLEIAAPTEPFLPQPKTSVHGIGQRL